MPDRVGSDMTHPYFEEGVFACCRFGELMCEDGVPVCEIGARLCDPEAQWRRLTENEPGNHIAVARHPA